MEKFTEGAITFFAENKQTRDAKVFFNPSRKFDRDLNILFINVIGKRKMEGIDLFGGSGVRSLRLAAETDYFSSITVNDIKTSAIIRKNIALNKKKLKARIDVLSMNAQDIYNLQNGYDYVDIDPFGSPVKYMVQALQKVRFGGLLAITATDSAALYGKAKKACMLKYGAVSLKTRYFNEIGLRILIKRTEEIANLSDRSIEPLLFDVRKHYLRVYLRVTAANINRRIGPIYQCTKCMNRGTECPVKCDVCGATMKQVGPMWLGKLFDRNLVKRMYDISDGQLKEYLEVMKDETDSIGYYTTDQMASFLKEKEKKCGLIGCRTVLDDKGFRTDMPLKDLLKEYKNLQ